jgi:hypothetical protein
MVKRLLPASVEPKIQKIWKMPTFQARHHGTNIATPRLAVCNSGAGRRQVIWISVSQPPGRGPVPGPGINYTGPREVLLEAVIFVFYAFFHE